MDPHENPAMLPMAMAKAYKTALVRRHGVTALADVPMTMLLARRRQPFAFAGPNTRDRDLCHAVIAWTLSETDCDEFLLIFDTFAMLTSSPDEGLEEIQQHGSLARLFAQGQPGVTEAISVVTWFRDDLDAPHHALAPYRIVAGRSIEWDDVDTEGEIFDGALHDIVHRGFRLQEERDNDPATDWLALRDRIPPELCHILPPIPVTRPPRNAPCPCGSGRKSKHCCYGPNEWENN